MRVLVLLLLSGIVSVGAVPAEVWVERVFRGENGARVPATLLDLQGEQALLRLADGREIWVAFERLSAADQEELRTLADDPYFARGSEGPPSPAILNRMLGLPLFSDRNLWGNPADETARRLGWRRESLTDTQESYRVYPPADARVLGARPYSAVLYGRQGKVEYLSLVFGNKGDAAEGRSETNLRQAAREIQNVIRADGQTIAERLQALGEPQRVAFGRGGGVRENLQWWEWEGHHFLLSVQDGNYTSLRIVPPEIAAARGRPERALRGSLAAQLREQVRRRDNGDTIIANIPMVDQGPKGYCVPATMERYLRYVEIPADMYLLALAAETGIGGGTQLNALVAGTRRWVNAHGRNIRNVNLRMRINEIASHIDEGQPILWAMYTTRPYNTWADRITTERSRFESFEEWEKRLRELRREAPRLGADPDQAHICLIVGYNRRTGEIAVSDSWGPRYEERWVPIEEASQVSQNAFLVVDP